MKQTFSKEPLSHCEKILNLDKWRSICLEKICECADLVVNGTKKTDEECRCELLDQFVAECMAGDKEVEVGNWRIDLNCREYTEYNIKAMSTVLLLLTF